MSTKLNIIDTVKELQDAFKFYEREKATSKAWESVSDSVMLNFPAVAQALLIAVDALETYSNEMPSGICDAADEALSHIQSL